MTDNPQEVTQVQTEALSAVTTLKQKIQALVDDAGGTVSGELELAKKCLEDVEAWVKIHIFGDEQTGELTPDVAASGADPQPDEQTPPATA